MKDAFMLTACIKTEQMKLKSSPVGGGPERLLQNPILKLMFPQPGKKFQT